MEERGTYSLKYTRFDVIDVITDFTKNTFSGLQILAAYNITQEPQEDFKLSTFKLMGNIW